MAHRSLSCLAIESVETHQFALFSIGYSGSYNGETAFCRKMNVMFKSATDFFQLHRTLHCVSSPLNVCMHWEKGRQIDVGTDRVTRCLRQ